MTSALRHVWAPVAACALALAGCGSGHLLTPPHHSRKNSQVAVIQAWATALQHGHIAAAAGYFAHPSVFANGAGYGNYIEAVRIHTLAEAEAVNESLSCGARLLGTQPNGRYITATFRLTNRSGPGADCGSGVGQEAATDFLIRNGRIVDWIRAVVPSTSTTPTVPTPTTPSSGQQI